MPSGFCVECKLKVTFYAAKGSTWSGMRCECGGRIQSINRPVINEAQRTPPKVRKPKVELRAWSTAPRPVRTSDGWRLRFTTQIGIRLSPERWATYDEAQSALDNGYKLPIIKAQPKYPSMVRLTQITAHLEARCWICSVNQAGLIEATHYAYLAIAPGKRRRFAICEPANHKLPDDLIATMHADQRTVGAYVKKAIGLRRRGKYE